MRTDAKKMPKAVAVKAETLDLIDCIFNTNEYQNAECSDLLLDMRFLVTL